MMPIENAQEFRSVGTWNVSFWAQFTDSLHAGLQSGQSDRTKEQLAGRGAFKGAVNYAGFSAKFRSCRLVTSL